MFSRLGNNPFSLHFLNGIRTNPAPRRLRFNRNATKTTNDLAQLKASFLRIGPFAEQTTGLFYARLFELDPTLRDFCHGDMAEEGSKLLRMLGLAVNGTERLDRLAPLARQLGLRQANFHVSERHYETVSEALLWTLAKRLGTEFTQEMQNAWSRIYWSLAETMRAGARDGAANLKRAAA